NGSYYLEKGFHFDPQLNPLLLPHLFMNSADRLVADGLASEQDEDEAQFDWSRTAFVNAEWFYGSDVGRDDAGKWTEPDESWQALKNFHAKVADHLKGSEGQKLGRWTINLAREMGSDGLSRKQDGVVNVKNLARLPMLLVQGLAVQHGLLLDPKTG